MLGVQQVVSLQNGAGAAGFGTDVAVTFFRFCFFISDRSCNGRHFAIISAPWV
jgi:hypothetical protein